MEKDKILFIHTPKTGGASMEYFLHGQTKKIRRNFFLSFNGIDDSYFIQDEKSTNRKLGNKVLIENIAKDPKIVKLYKNSPHFQDAKLLFGHTNMLFPTFFEEYNFNYIMVLREPIERTISNIIQFTQESKWGLKFGRHYTDYEIFTPEYWNFIYDILISEYPIKGLLIHENFYLRNCMSHMISANSYKTNDENINMDNVYKNLENINYSFYDNFNDGLQENFNKTGINIDMSQNQIPVKKNKNKFGKYYNAPDKIIDFVIKHNNKDIELYKNLKYDS